MSVRTRLRIAVALLSVAPAFVGVAMLSMTDTGARDGEQAHGTVPLARGPEEPPISILEPIVRRPNV